MAKKRKRTAFGSDAARAAHDARVDEHLRIAYDLGDRHFAKRGETRPADIVAYVHARYGHGAEGG